MAAEKNRRQIRAEAAMNGKSLLPIEDEKPLTSYYNEDEFHRGLYSPLMLPRVEELASRGCTDKEIAKSLGVAPRTFSEWKERHPLLVHSLKKYRGLADLEVENALYKSAIGFNFTEIKKERRKNPETGAYELIVTEEVTKHINGVPAAQIFYLKNRMPSRYKDKVDVMHGIGDDISQMAFMIKRRGEE